ncbi:DUF4249 domain-containing protein [Pontibacter liquoris]|uniref:DUF4249 domain-containing protein n=1 Tax=Pontibacter liquoris TaxID=2905677 RepID=UPI001FA6B37A|nr:DUF4249 domain-containing protein [Pontibacter liquoris]
MYSPNCLKYICWLWLLLLVSCVEPFEPKVLEGANNYLVVDGFINPSGTTTFRLSRTQNLSDESAPILETGASLVIEEQQGLQLQLTEIEAGTYTLNSLDLNLAGMYRLLVRTTDRKEYASDYVPVKQTPPIDEITWTAEDNTLQFYVSTHDPAQNARYYRWEYEGTWEYTAAFNSSLKYDAGSRQIVLRPESESLYRCWRTDASHEIKLATSVRLSEDVIHQFPVMALPPRSEELRFKYSLLVKQYSLTKEAYQYWEALKKNTESIGTLFDPLPTQLTGNIHCLTAPDEPVIGYVGASTVQEKRIFVSREQLPQGWLVTYPTCIMDTIKVEEVPAYFEKSHSYLPVGALYAPVGPPVLIGYLIAQNKCVDCRLRGTNVKPAFWQ